MSRPETALKANPPQRSRSVRRIVVSTIVLVLLVALLLLFGRPTLAWWTRRMAQARIHDGAISTAQGWLDWSAWFDSRDGATDLLRAACFRHLQQQDRWNAVLKLAEQEGVPASQVQQETRLGRIQDGIRRGMPGTSMRAFDKLSEDERMLLAQEVRRLNRLGIGEHFIDTLVKAGEEIDEREVREVVKRGTAPADAAWIPRIGPADPQAVARGKDAYFKLGCYNCHGADGRGVGDLPLFDEQGRPAPPRDLVHDAFKGGPEPESLYLRLLLGMPGTPHPACPSVAGDQLIDLVQYCRSLSREPKREWSNHQRALQAWTPPSR